jgi:hypothetical protein
MNGAEQMEDDQPRYRNLIVELSDNRRKYILAQKQNPKNIVKSKNLINHLFYNALPAVISSTLLFPIYKMRVLLQCDLMRFTNDIKEISNTKNAFNGNTYIKKIYFLFINKYLIYSLSLSNNFYYRNQK